MTKKTFFDLLKRASQPLKTSSMVAELSPAYGRSGKKTRRGRKANASLKRHDKSH